MAESELQKFERIERDKTNERTTDWLVRKMVHRFRGDVVSKREELIKLLEGKDHDT